MLPKWEEAVGSSQSLQHHEPNHKKGRTLPYVVANQSNDPQPSQQRPVLFTRIEDSESLMEQHVIKDCLDESVLCAKRRTNVWCPSGWTPNSARDETRQHLRVGQGDRAQPSRVRIRRLVMLSVVSSRSRRKACSLTVRSWRR